MADDNKLELCVFAEPLGNLIEGRLRFIFHIGLACIKENAGDNSVTGGVNPHSDRHQATAHIFFHTGGLEAG